MKFATQQVMDRVQSLVRLGRTDRQIAEEMVAVFGPGMPGYKRARDLRIALGLSRNAVRKWLPAEVIEAARRLNAEGLTDAEIVARMPDAFAGPNGVKTARNLRTVRGWPSHEDRRWPAAVVARVRALHADGLPDRAIARELAGVFKVGAAGTAQVRAIRLAAGLALRPDTEAKRLAAARIRAANAVVPGKAKAYRRFADRSGWPEDLPPRAVQILNVLLARGAATRPQLAAALGVPVASATNRKYQPLRCSRPRHGHGGYLALLVTRGLVAEVRRGPHKRVYVLTLSAILARKETLDARRQKAGSQGGQSGGPGGADAAG